MSIDELIPLTNGLSITEGMHTLVCDRARITPVTGDAIDMSFWIAGTDHVPRVRLSRARVERETPEYIARILRQVALRAVLG